MSVKDFVTQRPRIEVLFTGSELLEGRPNTHQNYLALCLKNAGLFLARATTVPDDEKIIAGAITESFSRCDALIICGGLGPTFDDLTREAAARALKKRLVYYPEVFDQIKKRFLRLKLRIPKENKKQAFLLDGAEMLANPRGSAPGQILEIARKNKTPQFLALLPGPFIEMSPLFEECVLPRLKKIYGRGLYSKHFSVHLSGISESSADEKLSGVAKIAGQDAAFTILGLVGQVDYHVAVWGKTPSAAKEKLASIKKNVFSAVGPFVFGENEETLESVVGRELLRKKKTLAVAESCTAGGFSARLTSVSGSSNYFRGGIVAYSNSIKTRLLGVSSETLARFGAVSSEVACEMADGVREQMKSSFGVSITGIAGPGGGSAQKPIGLVFVGLSGFSKVAIAHELRLSGERETIRKRATALAFHFLLKELKNSSPRA